MSIAATEVDCGLAIADAIKATAGAAGRFQYTDGAVQRSEMAVGAFSSIGPRSEQPPATYDTLVGRSSLFRGD